MAFGTGSVSAAGLLKMVTTEPAQMLRLETGCGRIRPDGPADLMVLSPGVASASGRLLAAGDDADPNTIARRRADPRANQDQAERAAESLLRARSADLSLVLVGGRPMLADPPIATALELGRINVRVDDAPKWLVGDPPALRARIAAAASDAATWGTNPVWQRLQTAPQ